MEPVLLIFLFVAACGVIAWLGHLANVRRREALAVVAAESGLAFDPEKNREIARSLAFIDALRKGSNRYAFNRLTGTYRDRPVQAFDYHFQTTSSDSKGRRQTHHHYFSVFVLELTRSFPELKIGPEGFFSKIAQALGYEDIDFESHDFSRRFCVRSPDKKFAYDFCNARMIEYLLAQGKISVEVERHVLAVCESGKIAPDQVKSRLDRLIELRNRMPDYLFAEAGL